MLHRTEGPVQTPETGKIGREKSHLLAGFKPLDHEMCTVHNRCVTTADLSKPRATPPNKSKMTNDFFAYSVHIHKIIFYGKSVELNRLERLLKGNTTEKRNVSQAPCGTRTRDILITRRAFYHFAATTTARR